MPNVQTQHYSSLQRNNVSDGVLIGQALAGDQRAFESLVNRYHHQLMGFTRSILKDQEQCYDVLQHVYVQLYLSLPILKQNGSLKPWLLQVTRHRCLDELRRKRRSPQVYFSDLEGEQTGEGLSPHEIIPDSEPLPEELAENSEMQSILHMAVDSLPPKFRTIVLLRCFRQLTFKEIGRTLHMPETTAKTYFYRALPRLRRALESKVRYA